jgi:2-polyprenyl-6-methoxyphenol hydroxylase-like FAD-dependent oxidoreductase
MHPSDRLSVVVAGGSLVGLAAAVTLGRAGVRVHVVERSTTLLREHGSGLGVELGLLRKIVGDRATSGLPVIAQPGRVSANWRDVYDVLRAHAERIPRVKIHYGVSLNRTRTARDHAIAELADGGSLTAHAVIGADGYRSTVRRHVDPASPKAKYAGYLLWRGVVEERDIRSHPGLGDRAVALALDHGLQVLTGAGRYLVTYPLPGYPGGAGTGQRRLSWNWYWSAPAGGPPWSSHPRTIPADELDPDVAAKVAQVAKVWRYPWPRLMELTVRQRKLSANAIYEYLPTRLARDRTVIIGDAAHVVTPMTGAGLINGFLDVLALTRQLASVEGPADVSAALLRYEQIRLGAAQDLAARSMAWSARFLPTRSGAAELGSGSAGRSLRQASPWDYRER